MPGSALHSKCRERYAIYALAAAAAADVFLVLLWEWAADMEAFINIIDDYFEEASILLLSCIIF